jgi:Xaa-Pro aminopeptidase
VFINVPRAQRVLHEQGLDGLLAATNISNVFYLSGIWRRADVAAVIHRDRPAAPWVAIPRSEVDYALEAVPGLAGVVSYGIFYREVDAGATLTERERRVRALGVDLEPRPTFLEALIAILTEAGLARGTVGYDERGLDPALAQALERRLPDASLVRAAATFRQIRMVKTPEEIDRLTRAVRITEEAIAEAVAGAREGMAQREMSLAFEVAQVRRGAQPNIGHVGFGRSAALGMLNFPEDRLRRGDVIRFDAGCIHRGYASDTARTFAFGPPPDKVVTYYGATLAGADRALAMIKPGVTGEEIFRATVETVRQAGIPHYRRQHVGHGIGVGLAGYDPPLLAPGDKTVLEPGMVLEVEPPYYELGLGGLQVEDTVLVTDGGCRLLTTLSRRLEVLEPRP